MKNTVLSFLLLWSLLDARAATNITTPTVTGHWTLAGSPYIVKNDIKIDALQSLEIDPGVTVLFDGNYRVMVLGSLVAVGTSGQPITFTVVDTTGWSTDTATSKGGWHGIQFFASDKVSADKSTLEYCHISYTKFVNGDYGLDPYSPYADHLNTLCAIQNLSVKHCSFFKNKQLSAYALFYVLTSSGGRLFFDDCVFYDNSAQGDIISVYSPSSSLKITNSELYNNSAPYIILSEGGKVNIERSEIYRNSSERAIIHLAQFGYGSGCNAVISGNKIHHNEMKTTAAITAYCGQVKIEGNIICNNARLPFLGCHGVEGGAGITCYSSDTSSATQFVVRNNIIANNFANDKGGGILIFGGHATITNNHIINNKSPMGTGIYFENGFAGITQTNAPSIVCNNLFYGNVNSSSGPGNISGDINAPIRYDHNWTQYTSSIDVNIPSATVTGDQSTNIVGMNPGIISPTSTPDNTEDALVADFRLLSSSDCVDKGDIVGLPVSYYDYLLNYRVSGSKIDIGAYEYGSSPAPIGLAVQESNTKMGNAVFPNPASSVVFVSTPSASGLLILLDVTGRKISEQVVKNTTSSFDVQSLPRGAYFVTWTHEVESIVRQVVLQ